MDFKRFLFSGLSLVDKIASLEYSESIVPELNGLFHDIKGVFPIVIIKTLEDCHIFRQRRNESNNLFSFVHELSYPPVSSVKSYGRVNIPGSPMFYGCCFGNYQSNEIPFRTSIGEVSELIKNPKCEGIERTTCSVWKVKDEIRLFALPFSDIYKNPTKDIIRIQNEWKSFESNPNISKENLALIKYMSKEIAKDVIDNYGYIKVAHFVNFLLNTYIPTKSFDGILFPSIHTKGEGYNVALKPSTVDRKLQFVSAHCCYIIKKSKYLNEVDVDFVLHAYSLDKKGGLIYKRDKEFDEKKYEDMKFIN